MIIIWNGQLSGANYHTRGEMYHRAFKKDKTHNLSPLIPLFLCGQLEFFWFFWLKTFCNSKKERGPGERGAYFF